MKNILIHVISLFLGVGGGVAGGIMLLPEDDPAIAENDDVQVMTPKEVEAPDTSNVEYTSLTSQFIVPVIVDSKVDSIIVLAIGLEIIEGELQTVLLTEPKLRSVFLQSLFNHANNGGFSENFTDFSSMTSLKRELLDVAKSISGDMVSDVLILDIVRQDP